MLSTLPVIAFDGQTGAGMVAAAILFREKGNRKSALVTTIVAVRYFL